MPKSNIFHAVVTQCILLIVMLLISGSNGNPESGSKITADVINKICSPFSNKNYCLGVLNSNPQIKTADLKGVAGILVQQAYFDASLTKSKATQLAQKETNAQLQQRYSLIAGYHSVIAERLTNAKSDLSNTDNIYTQAQAALVKVYSCEDLFLYPAPKDQSNLFQSIQNLDDLLNMIMADVRLIPK